MKIRQILTQLFLASALLAGLAAPAATSTWTNSASGGWDTTANWNPNTLPAAGDTAGSNTAGKTRTVAATKCEVNHEAARMVTKTFNPALL